MKSLTLKSIAKINLGLLVKEKRPDGFHNLETIFYPLKDIYDTLVFSESEKDRFSSNVDLPFSSDNLIWKAKYALEKISGKKFSVKIDLEKRIPMGSGLGGGSSNAATVLKGLNDLFELNFGKNELAEIALQLGSDVPFFLLSEPAFATSRGEILTTVELKINGVIALVNPGINISTKEAFVNVKPDSSKKLEIGKVLNFAATGFENANEILKNDFEPYVFSKYPVISEIKERLLSCGAKFSAMTGTGSTVYAIFSDYEKANKCVETFREQDYVVLISVEHGK